MSFLGRFLGGVSKTRVIMCMRVRHAEDLVMVCKNLKNLNSTAGAPPLPYEQKQGALCFAYNFEKGGVIMSIFGFLGSVAITLVAEVVCVLCIPGAKEWLVGLLT